jgi:8-oxo-dGTP pyrophosphatase MutT (NUDIX family)
MPRDKSQVAALPIRRAANGALEVLLITSRETGRWIIPKGWPMKGLADHEAAAQEAREEAGVVGRIGEAPIGDYPYWKRQKEGFEFCLVTVYPLVVERQRKDWRERGQRLASWLTVDDAAEHVDEAGLSGLIHDLPRILREKGIL